MRALLAMACVVAASLGLASASASAVTTDDYGFVPGTVFARAHLPVQQSQGGWGSFTAWEPLWTQTSPASVFQAGARPDASTGFALKNRGDIPQPLPTRTIMVDGPPGFIGSATAVPACSFADFMGGPTARPVGDCPAMSQVGIAGAFVNDRDRSGTRLLSSVSPIYKLPPPPDAPARFGYRTGSGAVILITPRLRSDGDYGLRLRVENLPSGFGLMRSVSTLWGVPWDPVHDGQRYKPLPSHLTKADRKAFLTNPTYCDSGPLERKIYATPWLFPDFTDVVSVLGEQAPDNCDKLDFGNERAPVSLTLQPDGGSAGATSGLDVRLRLPFNHDPYTLARPALRATTVELAEGLTVNPSAAGGLVACTEEEIGLKSLAPTACPLESRIGTVKVRTPLLADELDGALFLAEQGRNPFNSTMAVYLSVAGQGVQVKVAGRVDRDEQTGQITTSFEDNPQLAFTDLDLRLKTGPRATLVMPEVCDTYTTKSTLTPWSHPHTGPPVVRTDPFTIGTSKGCVSSLGARPFAPELNAGSTIPTAGGYSQFNARFERPDRNQEYDRITVKTPKGLAASIKDVPYCSEAGIAQAIARDKDGDGAVEKADPSCGGQSRVGITRVSAGAGPEPFYVQGNAYLAGPYKGAPLSLVFIVPAVAGPFDLGVQVVRAAINVDRRSAQITTVSDGIPQMLRGVPLRIRDIQVLMDRERFTVTPTNCDQQQVAADLVASHGGQSSSSTGYGVGDCAALPFKPRLSLELTGRNQRTTGKHPGVNAVVRQTGVGEAGIKKAKVTLPKSLALDVNNAQALCEFEDGTKDDLENHCPAGSIVGKAQAVSPLLKQPLKGNVYFVKNVRRDPKTGNAIRTLPMIIVALRGEVAINLRGESDTTRAGRLVNTFDQTPDAPISRFDLNMNGGANGILAVTRTRAANINLCTRPKSHVADALMDGQNGKRYDRAIRMKTPCSKRQIKKAKRAAKRAAQRR